MQEHKNKRSQRHHHYINKKHPQFEVTTYLDNPNMIQNLHENRIDAMEWAKQVEEQLDLAEEQIARLEQCNHELELEKQKLEIKFEVATNRAEILVSEKKEALEDVKLLTEQITKVKIAHQEILLQKIACEFGFNEARSKLEKQDSDMKNTLIRYHDLEEHLKTLQREKQQMELVNQRHEIERDVANHKLDEVSGKWRTFPQYIVTIVATAILSFGTSVVASSPGNITGWGMVIAGGSLEIVAFVITLTSRPKKLASLEKTVSSEQITEPERTAENG